MKQHVKTKLIEADHLLQNAKEELNKPEEDVVPYAICQSSYYAVVNYLNSFLLDQDIDIPDSSTVKDLLNNCRALNTKFKDLHLAPLYNPKESEDVWMNMNTARDFLEMADKTRQIVNMA